MDPKHPDLAAELAAVSRIMIAEENPFNHNGIGPGTNTLSYRSNDTNNPYNGLLLDGDFANLPAQVTSQQIVTRSRVGLVLDGTRAIKMAAMLLR